MSRFKRTTAVLFAAVLTASAIQSASFAPVYAEDSVEVHQKFYSDTKGRISVRKEVFDNVLKTASEDMADADYLMIKNIMKNAGISAAQQEMVLGQGWSDDLAAEVLFTELLMSSGFIDVTTGIYEQEYNRLIDTLVTSLNKNGGNADRNSIYKITSDSFDKYFGNYITPSQMNELKGIYSGKDYYDACVAYTAYKFTRDTVVGMMKKSAAFIPEEEQDNSFAAFMTSLSKSSTGVSVSSFAKVSTLPSIADGADRSKCEEYAQTFLTDYLDGKCIMLGILMPRFDMSIHKDIDFFGEVMERYNCDVDSRAEERNLFLGASYIYSYAMQALNDDNGYAADLLTKKNEKSVELYECGFEFYKNTADKMLEHAKKYIAVKSVKDNTPEDANIIGSILSEQSDNSSMKCHISSNPMASMVVSSFTVAGPADLSVSDPYGMKADVVNGKVSQSGVSGSEYIDYVNLGLNDKESKILAIIGLGSSTDLRVKARSDGKINISLFDKVFITSCDKKYEFKDIPVSKGDVLVFDNKTKTFKNQNTGAVYGEQQTPPVTTVVTTTPAVTTTKVTTTTTAAATTKATTPAVTTTKVTTTTTTAATTKVTTTPAVTTTKVTTTPVVTTTKVTTTPAVTTTKVTTTPAATTTKVTTTAPAVTTTESSKVPFIKGDINKDGSVTAVDIAALCQVILGIKPPSDYTDLNGNGQTELQDLVELQTILMN